VPGAHVTIDGEARARGRTPLTLTLPSSKPESTVRLTLDGYRAKTVTVRPNGDSSLEVTLEKSARTAKSHAGRPNDSDSYQKFHE
jgi:hypothetical protein